MKGRITFVPAEASPKTAVLTSLSAGVRMGDDIIEIKPSVGPFTLNVRALLRRFGKKGTSDPVEIVAARFLKLFQDHGIATSQIPRLIPQITLEKLRNTETLLPSLTPDVLELTSTLLGVRVTWLEGVDDRIYERKFCYKQPEVFFENFANLKLTANGFAVRALTTTKALDRRDGREQQLSLLLVEKAQDLDNEEICRYRVFGDLWNWSHPGSRIQLKAMARVIFQYHHKPVPLHHVTTTEIKKIIGGKLVPYAAMRGCLLTRPSLEDFSLCREESVVAQETEEFPAVLKYIQQHELEKMMIAAYQKT
jgi:hypothetical protein